MRFNSSVLLPVTIRPTFHMRSYLCHHFLGELNASMYIGVDATTAFPDYTQSAEVQHMAQKLGYLPVSAIQTVQKS
jgi:hypothetical protein